MTLATFQATISHGGPGGSKSVTTIQAQNLQQAKALLEAQYGRDNVMFVRPV
jgi:hypothetical protein